jgi:hypothetical protein
MSKKSRLKKQSEKQLEMKRLADLEELEAEEEAKHRESKGARKLRRRAKRGYSKIWFVLMKILMLAAFLWSGFFYGGVMVVGAFSNIAEFIPKSTAIMILIGDALMVVCIVLAILKKHRIQAFFGIPGSLVYLYAAQKIISDIQTRLEEVYVDSSETAMDVQYMRYFYPILVLTLFSLVLFIIAVVQAIKRRRKAKIERDNAPVASIIED